MMMTMKSKMMMIIMIMIMGRMITRPYRLGHVVVLVLGIVHRLPAPHRQNPASRCFIGGRGG
jgi:hypothetical protein